MSYVSNNLMLGETVKYTAKITWLIYLPSILTIVIGVTFAVISRSFGSDAQVILLVGGFFAFMGLLKLISAFIKRWTTELAVTSKRVIYKTGLIRRHTSELNHVKIESFHVDQSITGRIFDYGTIEIVGSGGGRTPITDVDNPLEFRKQAMQVMDANLS
jgi:uncharacterized membrane protein YdbT with pleckstrin-like domain